MQTPPALKAFARERMGSVGRTLGATGVHPNTLTLIGMLLNFASAIIVVSGHLEAGGVAFLIASGFDMLDGAVARATGAASRFGAFLDSVLDRYSEAAMLVALIVVFSQTQELGLVALTAAALVGSLLVSYARARAEGLGLDCEVGFLQRPERVILLAVGLLLPQYLLIPAVAVLAVVTNLTVVQRINHVRRLLSNEPTTDQKST